MIVFRAFGLVADRQILERICYDFDDKPMLEALRPSLEQVSQRAGFLSSLLLMRHPCYSCNNCCLVDCFFATRIALPKHAPVLLLQVYRFS